MMREWPQRYKTNAKRKDKLGMRALPKAGVQMSLVKLWWSSQEGGEARWVAHIPADPQLLERQETTLWGTGMPLEDLGHHCGHDGKVVSSPGLGQWGHWRTVNWLSPHMHTADQTCSESMKKPIKPSTQEPEGEPPSSCSVPPAPSADKALYHAYCKGEMPEASRMTTEQVLKGEFATERQ